MNRILNQKNFDNQTKFTIFTMSAPIPKQDNTGYKNAIATSFVTNSFKLGSDEILRKMDCLSVKTYRIFFITKKNIDISNIHFDSSSFNSSYLLTALNFETFFSLKCLEYLFEHNRTNSFEYIFVFENIL
jgi:hypothetical protein